MTIYTVVKEEIHDLETSLNGLKSFIEKEKAILFFKEVVEQIIKVRKEQHYCANLDIVENETEATISSKHDITNTHTTIKIIETELV